MIDATFVSRAEHFVPLSLLRHIAESAESDPPDEIAYIGTDGVKVVKAMPLVTRGRLSVQRVSQECWGTIQMMSEKGGWEEMTFGKKKPSTSKRPGQAATKSSKAKKSPTNVNSGEVEAKVDTNEEPDIKPKKGKKRKASDVDAGTREVHQRRSVRTKKGD